MQGLAGRLTARHRRPHVFSDVNITEVCERVRALIRAEFPRGLKTERDYDISIPDFRGDREQLIQAVLNIAHNAAPALAERITPGGDAQITLPPRISRQVALGHHAPRPATADSSGWLRAPSLVRGARRLFPASSPPSLSGAAATHDPRSAV